MAFPVLDDAALDRALSMPAAIEAVRRALRAKAAGRLVCPPRHEVASANGALAFTIGAVDDDDPAIGYRVYDRFPPGDPGRTQVTAVHDGRTGALLGLLVGDRLGPLRTGAIGGVAVDLLASPGAADVAVLGAGVQARTQLEAAVAVRPVTRVRVFSPTEAHRAAFAEEMTSRLGVEVVAVASARDAVDGAAIVLSATRSPTPVFDAGWLSPGVHVTTCGPKTTGAHELDPAVAAGAAVVATDAPAQLDHYPGPFFLDGTPERARIEDLADLLAGRVPGRTEAGQTTLFVSSGLAGTEVACAQAALAAARG